CVESKSNRACRHHVCLGAHSRSPNQTDDYLLPRVLRRPRKGAHRRTMAHLRKGVRVPSACSHAERIRGHSWHPLGILLGLLSTTDRATTDCRRGFAGHGSIRRRAVAFGSSRTYSRVRLVCPTHDDSALGGPDSLLCVAVCPTAGAERP